MSEKEKPHLKGITVSTPYKTYWGETVVAVRNSARTVLFLANAKNPQRIRNVQRLVDKVNEK